MIDELLDNADQYDFNQALRLLNRLADSSQQKQPNLRIRPDLSVDYPQADIERIEALPDGDGYELLTTFFGLYGVASPLPGYYTEELLDEEWDERTAQRDFLDIIHQRLYPLLYRAWLKYRFAQNAVEQADDRYWEILFSLIGLPQEFRRDAKLCGRLARYAGILNQQPKTQLGLKTILQDYLQPIAVDIEPCVARTVTIAAQQRAQLGLRNHRLGEDCLLGEQLQDRSGKFRIHIGPLTQQQFVQLGDDSDTIKFIKAICRLFLTQPLQSEIRLTLEKGAVQPLQLGEAEFGLLGQSSWLVHESNQHRFSVTLNG